MLNDWRCNVTFFLIWGKSLITVAICDEKNQKIKPTNINTINIGKIIARVSGTLYFRKNL
ncbi:hypothetical protein RG47T_1611 [Mucilaginibacter polytrichastri]|uniref:Uncharacterized protein n=1 Tax=Mucilaginibacter polytrichastri TaxID=1302689 RepID=A0A1Q5ZWP3_9SPHI|nr:hypothetical protein RG47T_1611 [Mucilaginibacter polytrichastri]